MERTDFDLKFGAILIEPIWRHIANLIANEDEGLSLENEGQDRKDMGRRIRMKHEGPRTKGNIQGTRYEGQRPSKDD